MRYSSKPKQPSSLSRHRDWDVRLIDFVNSVRKKPFSWGEHDCLTFANNCVIAQRGFGFDEDYLRDYDSVEGAVAVYEQWLEDTGCSNIVEGLDAKFSRNAGFPPRGSIVAMPTENGAVFPLAFGVMVSRYAAFVSDDGLIMVAPNDTFLSWRIE
jgi:hypothetical protein